MKILIITFGSRGDVQPYIALGKGLQSAGYKVTICTASRFESFITDHTLSYGYMTDEFLKILDTDTDTGRDIHCAGQLLILYSNYLNLLK